MKRVLNLFKSLMFLSLILFSTLVQPGVVASAAEDDSQSEPKSFNSIVEISEFYVEEGYIEPGKDCDIAITLHNANKYSAANGIIVSFSSNSGMIFPAYGSDNQIYAGSLAAGESTTVSIPVSVSSSFASDYAEFSCNISYESGGNKITNSTSMALPSASVNAVFVKSVDVSAHAIMNGKSLLSINYGNSSDYNINDAEIIIDGNVSEDTKSIKLDTIVAGKTYTKDFNIVYTEQGSQSIVITLVYTDKDGVKIEHELGTYDVTVDEEHLDNISDNSDDGFLNWLGRVIAVVGIAAALLSVLFYLKRK